MAREGTQKKLERVRPPRVNISYDVETGGAVETKELPFLMGVLADLSGNPADALPRLKDRKFVEVTPDNFDTVLKNMKPRVNFAVDNTLQEGGGKINVDMTFESLDDFSPEAVARKVGPLKELLDLRTKLADLRGNLQGNDKLEDILQATLNDAAAMKKLEAELGREAAMAEARAKAQEASTVSTELNLLDKIVEEGRLGRDAATKERGKDLVRNFVSEVLRGTVTLNPDTEAMINARIAQIDALISGQLNQILHHPDFQKLEGSWRGLKYLLNNTETGPQLKIKVFNTSKKELLKDLQKAPEFDQSALFKKVYEEEFGVFGGTPFGALLGDFEFGKSGQDIELLEKISQVAAAAHAPFISAASSDMFNMESFTQLDAPRDMAKVMETTEYAKWKGFRASDDARYVALTLPRILVREPYGSATVPVEAFNYEEGVDGSDHSKYLWGNAAWALGSRITQAFATYGWCATIRGVESGGLVDGLPVHNFKTESGDVAMKCPTESPISDRREKELADLGFAPLVHCKGTDYAAYFSVQSAQKPKVYDSDAATANARISAQLPYIFAVSRFAHYLKSIMRDKIGGFASKDEIQQFLNSWIIKYAVANDNVSFAVKASHPLKEARVEVVEVAGKPGVYRAVAFLRPHFQLDELSMSMRLVADLPKAAS